jgi:hypothetical protein
MRAQYTRHEEGRQSGDSGFHVVHREYLATLLAGAPENVQLDVFHGQHEWHGILAYEWMSKKP